MTDFPPSQYLIKKRENIKRLERIKVLSTYDKHRNILPLERETNPMILNDKDLFREAFTKHPNLAEFISCKIPKNILDDEDFMMEMYHLTKCIKIFGYIDSERLLFRLLKINLEFFDYCSSVIARNIPIMKKCLKEYPRLKSSPTLNYEVRKEFNALYSAVQRINAVKTFLLCVSKSDSSINWMRGCSGLYVRKIYEYIKPIYPNNKHIMSIPENLTLKCRGGGYHYVTHRISRGQYKLCEEYRPCSNCPNFEERKQWIELIRSKALSDYGFRVV
jgi:hypothetical protein